MLRTSRVAAFAMGCACGSSSPPAPAAAAAPTVVVAAPADAAPAAPLDQDLPRLVARSIAMYHDIAGALAGSDCAAVAGALGTLAGTYHDVVQANARVLHDGRAAELRAALEPHGDELDRSARAIMQSPTMAKCAQDAAFARAFDELLQPP